MAQFTDGRSTLDIPDLEGLSIPTLAWLHRAALSAGDVFEGLGFTTTNREAAKLLHEIGDCLTSLQNAVVDEMAERQAETGGERMQRALVLLDNIGRCSSPDEIRGELATLLETL